MSSDEKEVRTCPDNFQSVPVLVVLKDLRRSPTVGSHVKPAKDPTAMSCHPASERVIRLQSSQSRASLCATRELIGCSCQYILAV